MHGGTLPPRLPAGKQGAGRAELEGLAAKAGFRPMLDAVEGQVMSGRVRDAVVGLVSGWNT